jgi:hypothetical protein
MKTKSAATFLMALMLIWGAATPAQADISIFSNLGPNDSYNGSSGWPLGTSGGTNYYVIGFAFSADATANLSTIQVAAALIQGPNHLTIDLDADAGNAPGSTIESFTITGAMPQFGSYSSGHLVTATSLLNPLLSAGSQYWVVLSVPDDGTSFAAWDLGFNGDRGPGHFTNHGIVQVDGTENWRGAMSITGEAISVASSVPEPSGFAIVVISALAGLGYFWKRQPATEMGFCA